MKFFEDIRVGETVEIGSHVFTAEDIKTFAQRFANTVPVGLGINGSIASWPTFVFVVDNRFFGTLTAYAHEPYAARYSYTSAMAVQLLKSLGPTLAPLFGPARVRTAHEGPDGESVSRTADTPISASF